MILIVDLCYGPDSLSKFEFVSPIADTLRRLGSQLEVLHFNDISNDDLEKYDRIILCGTALKDNGYADQIDSFSWLKHFNKPVLGICAGMQVICKTFGGCIVPEPAIGLEKIQIVTETPLLGAPRQIEGYHLHNFGATIPSDFVLIAGTNDVVEAFKHINLPIYGIIFHPEVRNRWILERFVTL
jgi:GMP synthase-like glutamine amidotransferase